MPDPVPANSWENFSNPYAQTTAQTSQSKDFWGDLTIGGLLNFADKMFTSDEERMAAQTAQIEAQAKLAAANRPQYAFDPMQAVLFGLGAVVLVGGGVMAIKALKK